MNMNRRDFIKTTGAASAVAATSNLPLMAAEKGTGAKPNILIIVCDQMNLDAIAAYKKQFDHNAWLCHWVDTPNLDELISCIPSR